MLTKQEQIQVDLFVDKLGVSLSEAMELLAFDKEVNSMTVKQANGDMPSVSKTPTTSAPAKKKSSTKKTADGYTPNQALALETLKANGDFMSGKQLSETTEGALNSRGLGSVMKKLIESNLVEKKAGSPVQYKYIGE